MLKSLEFELIEYRHFVAEAPFGARYSVREVAEGRWTWTLRRIQDHPEWGDDDPSGEEHGWAESEEAAMRLAQENYAFKMKDFLK